MIWPPREPLPWASAGETVGLGLRRPADLVTVRATAPDPVLELALRLVEGSVDARVRALGVAFVDRRAAHEELTPGNAQVDGDAVAIAVAMMVARQVDHDVARHDPVEHVFQLLGAPPDMGGQGG